MRPQTPLWVGSHGDEDEAICSSLLGAVGKGHFVINIFKNQMSGVWGWAGGGGGGPAGGGARQSLL